MTDPVEVVIDDDRPDEIPGGGRVGPEAPDPAGLIPPDGPVVTETEIVVALRAVGATTHALVGHPEVRDHWNFTADEVAQLAPPVTSIVNRHAYLRRMAAHSPELAAAAVLGQWGLRNMRLSAGIRQAIADTEEDTEEDAEDAPRAVVDLSYLRGDE